METNRTENALETEAKPSRGFGSYVLWAFVVLVLYVLSWPPVLKWFPHGVLPESILYVYLRPVDWALQTPLRRPLARYLRLWNPPDKNQELERKRLE